MGGSKSALPSWRQYPESVATGAAIRTWSGYSSHSHTGWISWGQGGEGGGLRTVLPGPHVLMANDDALLRSQKSVLAMVPLNAVWPGGCTVQGCAGEGGMTAAAATLMGVEGDWFRDYAA